MSDLLFQNGDIIVDKYGDISLCPSEDIDILQMANNNIMLRFGNNKFHNNLGNKIYNKRIKANANGIETVKSECINAIINSDPRIRKVEQINVTLADDANCIVDYVLVYINSDTKKLTKVDGRVYIDAFNMEGGE